MNKIHILFYSEDVVRGDKVIGGFNLCTPCRCITIDAKTIDDALKQFSKSHKGVEPFAVYHLPK